MAEYKNQHYIPVFYLKKFCSSELDTSKEPSVWVCERGNSITYKKSPKNIAKESYYYSYIDDEGERRHEVEEYLSLIESNSTKPLLKLETLNHPNLLSKDDRKHISLFFSLMQLRNLGFRTHWEKQYAKLYRMIGLVAASHKKHFHRIFKELIEKGEVEEDTDIERIRNFALSNQYEIKTDPMVSLKIMIDQHHNFANLVHAMNWRILRCPTKRNFITSDYPLVMVSTLKDQFFPNAVGWASPFMEANIPITPKTTILLSMHHPEGEELLNEQVVNELNFRIAAHANKMVFSSEKIDYNIFSKPEDWIWWEPATDILLDEFK